MPKMWAGRTDGHTDQIADDFNSSIHFDSRMYRQDITGSMAHASMLAACHIITEAEADTLIAGLEGILTDIESGALPIDMTCEDIHMFVEQVLTERLGDVGKKLHTARSRNDQVALDIRMYLRDEITEIIALVRDLIEALTEQAEANAATIMPGYTHLQRAQPITFGHHLMAYAMMLLRDIDRLKDVSRRMNLSPIGSCALAGTTYNTDRRFEAARLGFDGIVLNSLDGVSDRDFAVEFISACALMMMQGTAVEFSHMAGFILMLGVVMVAAPGVPGGAIMAALGVLQSMLGFGEQEQALMIALYITMDNFGTACNVTGDGALALILNKFYKE